MAENPEMPIENGANGAVENAGENSVPSLIEAQYIKDLSFENPRGIETYQPSTDPDVSVDVSTNARPIGEEGMFEVSVFIRAEASLEDALIFIELTYSGIVQVSGVPEEMWKPIVLIEGPHRLFPVRPHNHIKRGARRRFPAVADQPDRFRRAVYRTARGFGRLRQHLSLSFLSLSTR